MLLNAVVRRNRDNCSLTFPPSATTLLPGQDKPAPSSPMSVALGWLNWCQGQFLNRGSLVLTLHCVET